ncbi:MAG TPA: hypothetical protein VKF60_07360 [Myxococcota bacterium]|nr:hypothetical protein [Myxococcota bacterium]
MRNLLIVCLLVAGLLTALAPSVVALARDHPRKWMIVGVNVLLGPLGFLVALSLLIAFPVTETAVEESEPQLCTACGASYRVSDYRPDAVRILCSRCGAELIRGLP